MKRFVPYDIQLIKSILFCRFSQKYFT